MGTGHESLFRALADTQRRTILRVLRGGEHAAGELADALGLAPATLSHHLSLLRTAGLVRVRRDGRQRIYALNTSVMEDAMVWMAELLKPPSEGKQ
ncbi:MAG: metalloregulator ArsR/SmtB family transcription factor [Xanthomonadales bacterium]|nr:metalloregulator ArsR/SmtB family transcription factor [Xanthomonadales bacterium]